MDFVCKLYSNTYAVHVTVALVGVTTLNLALPPPPPCIRSRTNRPHQRWYNSDIHVARRFRRKYERMWRKSKLEVHHELYVAQRIVVNDLIDNAKKEHYRTEFEHADTKTIFKKVNTLLNQGVKVLPDHESDLELSSEFSAFFADKVDKIYNGIE